jgi:hypothetical protein
MLRKVSVPSVKGCWVVLEDLKSTLSQLNGSFFAENVFQSLPGVTGSVVFPCLRLCCFTKP